MAIPFNRDYPFEYATVQTPLPWLRRVVARNPRVGPVDIKITKWGAWMMLDRPTNIATATIQMIQRGEAVTPDSKRSATSYSAGTWTDIVVSISGKVAVSPITGGICWEQKK